MELYGVVGPKELKPFFDRAAALNDKVSAMIREMPSEIEASIYRRWAEEVQERCVNFISERDEIMGDFMQFASRES